MAIVKFPCRYYQQRDIRKHLATALLKGQASNNVHKAKETKAGNKTKVARKSRQHALDCSCDYGFDYGHKGDNNLGYSLDLGYDELTKTYKEIRTWFVAEGLVMPSSLIDQKPCSR